MNLTIVNRSGQTVPHEFLKRWVQRLDRIAGRSLNPKLYRGRELVIAFLTEEEARQINKSFRGKDYATDVLSFGSDDPSSLGELVICPKVISKQAREHGLLVREELGYMVLHGFLHLLGFDHEKGQREADRMFALQDELFEKLLK